jgi:hypothetical protein
MTFTNDDLKRLKKDFINASVKTSSDLHDINALLARLEAAEAYARYGDLLHGGKSAECVLDKCDMCLAKKAWRKAAGLKP